MALKTYDELTPLAQAVARNAWRFLYRVDVVVGESSDGFWITAPQEYSDEIAERGIRDDPQELGFRFQDDGTVVL